MQDLSRRIYEHRSHHDEQKHGEHQHQRPRGLAQIVTNKLGQSGTVVTHREHTCEIIMDGTCEDTTEHDPQIGGRTELGTHDGTEDGTRACDVKELDHENLPIWKYNVIKPVGFCYSGRHTVIRSEDTLHKASIEQITQHKSNQAQQKCNHFLSVFE